MLLLRPKERDLIVEPPRGDPQTIGLRPTGVVPGTYDQVTVDDKGRVLSGTNDPGPGGGLDGFRHVQMSPANIWTAAHPLGRKPFVAQVWIAGETWLVPVEADETTFTARFAANYTGELALI